MPRRPHSLRRLALRCTLQPRVQCNWDTMFTPRAIAVYEGLLALHPGHAGLGVLAHAHLLPRGPPPALINPSSTPVIPCFCSMDIGPKSNNAAELHAPAYALDHLLKQNLKYSPAFIKNIKSSTKKSPPRPSSPPVAQGHQSFSSAFGTPHPFRLSRSSFLAELSRACVV